MKGKIVSIQKHSSSTFVTFEIQEEIPKSKIADIFFDDGKTITVDQRKKLYATFSDIADWYGDTPEYIKAWFKLAYELYADIPSFSLSNCHLNVAKGLISYCIAFCLKHGVQLTELAINRTEEIGKYLWYCLVYKKCAICGRDGETHHWDAIGMGNDRKTIDDSNHKKICLCRVHHGEAHSVGNKEFGEKYKVYGIKFKEDAKSV